MNSAASSFDVAQALEPDPSTIDTNGQKDDSSMFYCISSVSHVAPKYIITLFLSRWSVT